MKSVTRRAFGGGMIAALSGSVLRPSALNAQTPPDLVARPAKLQLAPQTYPATEVWGYNGTVPGPTIRVAQGGRVTRRFVNELDQPGTVHWHGIRIDNAMDGVPGLTQEVVAPGDSFLYDFAVPDAGTYWYHPHNRSYEQMARGLSGALIIEEADGAPEADSDEVLLIDDWRLDEQAQIADGFGDMHDWAHGGRIGNWITVNGNGDWRQSVARFSRHRLRLVNTANARILALETRGLEGWVVALDGMPLDQPEPLDRLILAPAQRADILVDVTAEVGEEAYLVSFERDGGYAIASFDVTVAKRTERLGKPTALPPNPVPPLGALETARTASLLMEGGAMGRMSGAMMGGQMTDMRDMVSVGKVWAFNGMAEMPDTPLLTADRGETVVIEITNDTSWPHAMHLHGHHFRQIAADGTAGALRDTLLMEQAETAKIAFVADNPGDWMLHCHMLEHSAGGMMTWLRVV